MVAVIAVATLMAACDSSPEAESSTTNPASTSSVATASPSFEAEDTAALGEFPPYADVAVPESVAEALQSALDDAVEDGYVRGATAAVIIVGGGSWSGAVGLDGEGNPLTPESRLLTASVGKTMTAAQILRLVDEGTLALDDRAADHLPPELASFAANEASIQDLLGMRSGLVDPGGYVNLVDQGSTTADLVALLPPPTSPAGSATHYANINYLLLGEIIEEVTGSHFADAIRAGVLDRPGLGGLAYRVEDAMAADGWEIETDAPTLARWGYELYGGFVVSDASLRAMTDFGGEFYGLGTVDFSDEYGVPGALGHGGLEASHAVRLVAFPEAGVVVSVQANADGFDELRPLVNALRDAAEF